MSAMGQERQAAAASGAADPLGERLGALTPVRAQEARRLDEIFREVTGFAPRAWRSVIGYGLYHYRYASGREGTFCATGFSPQAGRHALHILPGYTDFPQIAERLGPHTRGRSCWYIKRLSDVDEDALRDLIREGLADLASHWPVEPT